MGESIFEFGFSSALTLSKHLNMQIFDRDIKWNTEDGILNYTFLFNYEMCVIL